MSGGIGGGGFGGGPYGGSASVPAPIVPTPLPTGSPWDVFLTCGGTAVALIPYYIEVSLHGSGASFASGPGFFDVCSGYGTAPTSPTAHVEFNVAVNSSFTLEFTITFDALPDSFLDLPNEHFFVGAQSLNSSAAGLFISDDGLEYTGAVAYSGTDLVVASPVVPIPGTAGLVLPGVQTTFRIVADDANGTALIYVTPTAQLVATGHQLVAIVPLFTYADASPPPASDAVIISARSAGGTGSCGSFSCIRFASKALISNIAPIADPGDDQAVRHCSIVELNGSRSYDPEGEPLTYEWRLIDAPPGSTYSFEGGDGSTTPDAPPTGYTATFSSSEAEVEHAVNPFEAGDVLVVRGVAYTIQSFTSGPFSIVVESAQIPDDVTTEPFKILRHAAISQPTSVTPTFYPDKTGFFVFDLRVNDGVLSSDPTGLNREVVLVNVLESVLPRGVVPDASFIFDYLLSFWKLVEDRDVVAEFWTALSMVAATELYTLWQLEYSKSIRDIQRLFVRRWIHYDLMLPEPLPDVVQLKTIWGGALSDPQSSSVSGINGTSLVVATPATAGSVTLTFRVPDPVSIQDLRGVLENSLRNEVDDAFRVTAIENRNTSLWVLRVWLDKPFTLGTGSTLPIFPSYPQRNGNPSGTGVGVGTTVFDTDYPLDGLGIEEDDVIVVGRVGYRVSKLVDNSADDYPFERVLLKEELADASTSWSLPGWVQSGLLDFYSGLVDQGDVVEFEVLQDDPATPAVEQIASFITTTAHGVPKNLPRRLAVDTASLAALVPENATSVYLARVVRRHYVPIDELIQSVPTLTAKIVIEDDTETLRENADYVLSSFRGQPALKFQAGTPGDLGDVWEGTRPPDRLWAEYTYVDNSPLIEANFGIPIGLLRDEVAALPDNVDYLSAVRGLWYAYYNGPKIHNVRTGAQILLGLPFSEEDGVIEELRDDFILKRGRILIRDTANPAIVRSYEYPNALDLETNPSTGAAYKVGDSVSQFAPLVRGVEVLDYVNSPTWYEGVLNQGIFYEVEKYHTFLVRVASPIFNLSAIQFVQRFINTIRPIYNKPFFVIEFDVSGDGDEIDITDTIATNLTMFLYEDMSSQTGWAGMVDDPDPSGDSIGFPDGMKTGAWKNAVDTDEDLVAPTPPTPDSPILWGVDKQFLRPSDVLEMFKSETQPKAKADITAVSGTEADFTLLSGSWADIGLAGVELGDVIEVVSGSNSGALYNVTDVSGFPGTFRGTWYTGPVPTTEAGQTLIFCPEVDSVFRVDESIQESMLFTSGPPASVPVVLTASGSNTAQLFGSSLLVTVLFEGTQGDLQTVDVAATGVVTADVTNNTNTWAALDVQLGDYIEVVGGLNDGSALEVVDVSGLPGTVGVEQRAGNNSVGNQTGATAFVQTPRYVVRVLVNGIEQGNFTVIVKENREETATLAITLSPGDTVDVHIDPAGAATRFPDWTSIRAIVRNVDSIMHVDTPLAAGVYCNLAQLYP